MTNEIKKRVSMISAGEVPEGYEHTLVGIIPKDWECKKLKDIAVPVKRKNSAKVERVLTASGQYGLVSQNEFFNKSVASEDISEYYCLKKGEFAYNRSSMNGYPYGAIKRLELYDDGALSTLYMCFALKNIVFSDFYSQLFLSEIVNRELYKIIQVGARAHGLLNVAQSDFYDIHILFPPIPEQEKIAEILTTCDKVIELKERLIAEKQQQKNLLMQDLLSGKKRLQGFSEPWKERSLNKVFSFIRNGFVGTATPDYCDNGVQYIEGTNIQVGKWSLSKVQHISVQFHKAHPNSVLQENDVVVVQSGHVGECTVVTKDVAGSNCHAIIIMTPTEAIHPFFCAYYINSKIGKSKLKGCITGNTIKHILASDMKKLVIDYPPITEQIAIANVLSTANREIELMEKDLAEWKNKNKALMQLLLVGKVRVNA